MTAPGTGADLQSGPIAALLNALKNLGVDVTEFTPIGRMALDTFLLWVNAEEEIDSLEARARVLLDA